MKIKIILFLLFVVVLAAIVLGNIYSIAPGWFGVL